MYNGLHEFLKLQQIWNNYKHDKNIYEGNSLYIRHLIKKLHTEFDPKSEEYTLMETLLEGLYEFKITKEISGIENIINKK